MRTCAWCSSGLPADTDPRRKYCDEECKSQANKATQRSRYAADQAYREQMLAQHREWMREHRATDDAFRAREREQKRKRSRERYATDEGFREKRLAYGRAYRTDPDFREQRLERKSWLNARYYATHPDYRERKIRATIDLRRATRAEAMADLNVDPAEVLARLKDVA